MSSRSRHPKPDRALVATATAAIALGAVVLVGSFAIPLASGYDRVGPRFFPWVVGGGLLLSGGLLLGGALRHTSVPESASRHGAKAIGTLALGLVSAVLLLEPAGFVLASTLLFWLVARAFASRRPIRDALVGLVLSAVVHVAFTRGLGLALPGGLLGGVL